MFAARCREHRVVLVPPGLTAEQRSEFIDRVTHAAHRQAELARRCASVLMLEPHVALIGERLIIRHEPAAPLTPIAAGDPDRPDVATLWWLTAACMEALAAAGSDLSPHGGLQPGSLVQDEYGHPKLTDFGLAPAFEATCGIEARRHVHCDAAGPRRGNVTDGDDHSAVWRLLGESDQRDDGWIAPYFGHELLEDRLPLNARSDQFSLGVLLYRLATRAHPYGATFDDPALRFYFQLEPNEPADDRPEWKSASERSAKQLAQPADRPVIDWTALVRRLLARDVAARFDQPAEALAQCQPHVGPAWTAADRTIAEIRKDLERDRDRALDRLAALAEDERLPGAWRQRLRIRHEALGRDGDADAALRASRMLRDARAAMEAGEIELALDLAHRARQLAQPATPAHAAADEIVTACEEARSMIPQQAAEIAGAYLEGAQQAIRDGRTADAAHILGGMVRDRATPDACKVRARELLAEIQRQRQQLATWNTELSAGRQELSRGAYEAARARMLALERVSGLPSDVRQAAATVLADIEAARTRRKTYAGALEAAQEAWQRADGEGLATCLAQVPDEFGDPEIAGMRRDLRDRSRSLEAALADLDAARRLDEQGQADAAAERFRVLHARADLPQALRDQAAAWLRARSGGEVGPVSPTRLDALLRGDALLDDAEAALANADVAAARDLITRARDAEPIDATLGARCDQLNRRLTEIEELSGRISEYQKRLDRHDLTALVHELSEWLQASWLPAALRRDLQSLQTSANQRLTAHRTALDETLDRLEIELARRRRAADWETRATAVCQDDLAAAPQRARATELLARLAEAPPAPPWWRKPALLGLGALLLAALALAGYFAWPGIRGQSPAPEPNEPNMGEPNRSEPNGAAEPNQEPNQQPVDPALLLSRTREEFSKALHEKLGAEPRADIAFDADRATVRLGPPGRRKPLEIAAIELPTPQSPAELAHAMQTAVARAQEAAARIALMRAAVDALMAGAVKTNLPDEYADRLAIRNDDLLEIESPAGLLRRVPVRSSARLAGDDRPDAGFALRGDYTDGQLELDEPSRSAFFRYLTELQSHRAGPAIAALRVALALPADVPLSPPPDFAGGAALALALGPRERPLAQGVLTWDAGALAYQADLGTLQAAISAGLRALAADPAEIQRLREQWPALRERLAPQQGALGSAYWRTVEARDITVRDAPQAGGLSLPVTLSAARPGGGEREELTLASAVRYRNGQLEWDDERDAEMRGAVAAALARLAAEVLPEARAAALLDVLKQRGGVRFTARIEGQDLVILAEADCRTRENRVRWDPERLDWIASSVEAPPPLPLDTEPLLDAIADQRVCQAPFTRALAGVGTEKVLRQDRRESWAFAAALAEQAPDEEAARRQLVALTQALQRRVAEDCQSDVRPTVFVEYYAGRESVFGLSWRAVDDPQGGGIDVADLRVWRVMKRAALDQLAPEPFRSEYTRSDGPWRATLLDPALPAVLEGAADGAFGVLIAPDGPLWLTRWEQVRFTPRRVQGIRGGAEKPAETDWLRPLLLADDNGGYPRAGIWCVPSLGVERLGDPAGVAWNLGVLAPGRPKSTARFKLRGRGDLLLSAPIEDPTPGVESAAWGAFAGELEAREAGAAFWDFGWKNGVYVPQSVRGLSLLPRSR